MLIVQDISGLSLLLYSWLGPFRFMSVIYVLYTESQQYITPYEVLPSLVFIQNLGRINTLWNFLSHKLYLLLDNMISTENNLEGCMLYALLIDFG